MLLASIAVAVCAIAVVAVLAVVAVFVVVAVVVGCFCCCYNSWLLVARYEALLDWLGLCNWRDLATDSSN